MLIYKIFRAAEWQALQAAGETAGAPIDIADGYVHFSTAAQVGETAAKYFVGVDGLVLLALDSDALGADLRWEPARGGALFPHLYDVLSLEAVVRVDPLPVGEDGEHVFPPHLAGQEG